MSETNRFLLMVLLAVVLFSVALYVHRRWHRWPHELQPADSPLLYDAPNWTRTFSMVELDKNGRFVAYSAWSVDADGTVTRVAHRARIRESELFKPAKEDRP